MQYWSNYFGCWRDDEDNDIPNDMPNDISNDCEDEESDYNEIEYDRRNILYFSEKEREWWRALGEELDRTWGKAIDGEDISFEEDGNDCFEDIERGQEDTQSELDGEGSQWP